VSADREKTSVRRPEREDTARAPRLASGPASIAPADNRGGARGGVTVLIGAYNAADFLERAVRSAQQQTLPPLEILIVDDGSQDRTAEVASQFAAADPRIRLLRRAQNGGPSAARNTGIDAARGEWIAILDADDAFLPDRLERLIEVVADRDADVIADNFFWYDASSGAAGDLALPPGEAVEWVDKYSFVAHARPRSGGSDWGLLKPMFRKSFLDSHGMRYPVHSRHGEDFLLVMDILLAGGRYIISRYPGYLYTMRSSGLSRTLIDYQAMAAHTLALIDDDRARFDPKLTALLRERNRSVRRWAAMSTARSYFNERKRLQIFFLSVRDHVFLHAVLALAAAKFLRSIGGFVRRVA